MDLDCEIERLKHEKEERDNAIRTLTKEKQLVATENFALKDELQKALHEKAELLQEKTSREQDSERERARTETEVYTNSRQWFLQEIAQRDNKCAEMKIEMSSKELAWQRERLQLKDDIARLQLEAEDHSGQVQLHKKRAEEAVQRIEQEEKRLRNLEVERKGTKIVVKRLIFGGYVVQHYVSFADEEIAELKEELNKANELLKSKHAVHLNVSEDELAVLSPAAVETARLLRGGQSLTSIVREHARLTGELAEARERNKQLELNLREMVEEIEERAPQLFHQKELLDKTFDHNSRLQEQLKEADEARRRLESAKDATTRELAFTRAELEKYQRDYAKVSKQVQHLLFVMEKERRGEDEGMNENEEENARLFSNIAQLQKLVSHFFTRIIFTPTNFGKTLLHKRKCIEVRGHTRRN
ncbi:unnamed protein product [Cylicostephanus goldi]|uniref:Uncharacterized protein n=1 Tax=Cylicostephanus goldi TaxID=71465 RepID=A0A3P7M7U8_CYLGO|nr:unnamed protein product [Cylicostephanus goldi]